MKYATWRLNWDNGYGTGPEEAIIGQGIIVEAALADGQIEQGARILGYVSEAVNESKLIDWDVKNVSQQEALEFSLNVNSSAYFLSNGKIGIEEESPYG